MRPPTGPTSENAGRVGYPNSAVDSTNHLAVHNYRPTQENALRLAVGMLYYRLINEGNIMEGKNRQSDRRSSSGDKPSPT